MLFNSIEFIYFLPCVVLLYYAVPHRFRWVLHLAASYLFYMLWRVEYIFLIVGSTLVDFYAGKKLEVAKGKKRLRWLILSLTVNLGLLFTFKYLNFFSTETEFLFQKIGWEVHLPHVKWLLPVGISFYTFQTLSYTIDVYFKRIKAEQHLGYFALYVSFFPQLVAGPIERYNRLAPQLKTKQLLTYENLSKGFRLILYGLFAKMVIADNLGFYVEEVYTDLPKMNSKDVLTGVGFYSFQIYGDFYGYSLVAIGSAKLLGINIMDNFKTPYLAQNIAEFWQRWHVSLSTWFRDYLYYPLGGNKVKKQRWVLNVLIVFVVSGLWHGANWTFIIWGGLFGVLYLVEKVVFKSKSTLRTGKYGVWNALLSFKTFVLVSLIWVFFRSENLPQALEVFGKIGNSWAADSSLSSIPIYLWVCLGFFILSDVGLYNNRFDTYLDKLSFPIRWFLYGLMLFAIIVFAGVHHFPFIYFQF